MMKCISKWMHGCLAVLTVLLLMPPVTAQAQPSQKLSVSGVVTSTFDGEPILGVTVQVKGTSNGTITDADGKYSLQVDRGSTLVFSYVGYTTQELKATSTRHDVALVEANEALEEVVVVGYGVQKKKLVTGATLQVKGDDIAKLSTSNPLQALQGQTPGMTIMSSSGQPGEGLKVSIRGLGTVGNSGPLFIIDGVRGDISSLNASDIESIDVLKDAASAAIYGNQSGNGVVLVTTKNGREGKAVVSFNAYVGWQNVARKAKMLNAAEYMAIMDEQNINSGGIPYDWASMTSIRDANGNIYDIDWVDAMFKDNAKTQNYNFSVTGGNKNGNFAVSGGYLNQEGIVGGADVSNYERYNFRVNSEYKVIDNFLKIGEQVSIIYAKKRGISVGNQYNNTLRGAFDTAPITPIYSDNNPYGSPYNDTSNSDWDNTDGNPYGLMMTNINNRTNTFTTTANLFAEFDLYKNLKFRSSVGVKYDSQNYRSFTPMYHFSIYSYNDTKTSASQSSSDGFGITWTNTLSYDWKIKDHSFSALLGTESYRSEGVSQYGSNGYLKDGFNTWQYAYLSNGDAKNSEDGLSVSGSPWDEERMMSYFGRISWNWKERYMATATLRCDGAAKFSKDNRYGWFPSVSAGWILSNEKWAQNFAKSIRMDYFKLRASWGQVGNQDIGNYMFLAPVTSSGVYYNFGTTLGSEADQYGNYISRLANADLKWETSEQTNIGIDARFLASRLGLTVDYYIKKTKDWLVQPPTYATAGTGAPYVNGGDVTNKGVEVALTWNDQIGDDFTYSASANMAYNHNEVGSIPTEGGIIHGQSNMLYDNSTEFYRASNGEPIGYFWGYKTAGVFQNEGEINDWIAAGNGVLQSDPEPGDVKYYDINHDGVINDDDKVNLGKGMPDVTYGFSLACDWKGLDFSLTASGTAGRQIVQSYRNVGTKYANYTTAILDRWTGEGTSNFLPRVTNGNVNYQFSDLFIQDGDFLRITDVTLGYDFCKKLLKTKHISQCRLYFQVKNLFTFTKYDGMDPEIGYGTDSWISGIDLGYYPTPRTIHVGVNLKF